MELLMLSCKSSVSVNTWIKDRAVVKAGYNICKVELNVERSEWFMTKIYWDSKVVVMRLSTEFA